MKRSKSTFTLRFEDNKILISAEQPEKEYEKYGPSVSNNKNALRRCSSCNTLSDYSDSDEAVECVLQIRSPNNKAKNNINNVNNANTISMIPTNNTIPDPVILDSPLNYQKIEEQEKVIKKLTKDLETEKRKTNFLSRKLEVFVKTKQNPSKNFIHNNKMNKSPEKQVPNKDVVNQTLKIEAGSIQKSKSKKDMKKKTTPISVPKNKKRHTFHGSGKSVFGFFGKSQSLPNL